MAHHHRYVNGCAGVQVGTLLTHVDCLCGLEMACRVVVAAAGECSKRVRASRSRCGAKKLLVCEFDMLSRMVKS